MMENYSVRNGLASNIKAVICIVTYQETISFLFSQLPVYQRDGEQAIKKDLTNIIDLCSALGNPHKAWPSIHIAGTNGKGTVTHMIAASLQAQGYRIGIYSSPHYIDFRERIKINGAWISEEDVVSFVERIRPHIEQIKPSFFEITVAMAFDYFAREDIDYGVIETGLGGRLDSTNIIKPLLSVITNISLDHMNMLGDSIYEIAHEKAGIIKPNVPVIIGQYQPSCDIVFIDKAKRCDSEIQFASLVSTEEGTLHAGPFRQINLKTASHALHYLKSHEIIRLSDESINSGLDNFEQLTGYMGRWQILQQSPTIIADSAHNIDAIAQVMARLKSMEYDHLRMVMGFVKEKDLTGILSLLPKEATYYLVRPTIFRAIDLDSLGELFDQNGMIYKKVGSVEAGYELAQSQATQDDLVYVGGSSFVVGDLLAYLAK